MDSTAPQHAKRRRQLSGDTIQRLLALGALIVMIIVFAAINPTFINFTYFVRTVLVSMVAVGVLSLGVTFVIITGGIDLSVGTVMTFSSVIAGVFITNWQLGLVSGILAGILAGTCWGMIAGMMVSKMRLPAFIATLSIMMITKGLSLIITGSKPIYFSNTPVFSQIAMGSIFSSFIKNPNYQIPNMVLIYIVLCVIAAFILNSTLLGRYDFAIGSNEEATRLSGVNVSFWKIMIYALSGTFVGVAGIIMASRMNSASPALGQGYELEAIAAVVIGGTSLSGGAGSIVGTVIGSMVMAVLTQGLSLISVQKEWQSVIIGIVLVVSVFADALRRGKKA